MHKLRTVWCGFWAALTACLMMLCSHSASFGQERPAASLLPPVPQELTLPDAVAWALQNNPELAALRQQQGVAAAGVVIARTYPHNPTFEAVLQGVSGPRDTGITTPVQSQYILAIPVEIRQQGRYRREAAFANLSRAEWDIAHAETLLAIRVAKAFRTVIYQQQKLQLIEETIQLNQQGADQVKKLVEAGKLRPADLILARSEVDDVRAQLPPARASLTAGAVQLARSLGVSSLNVRPLGSLAVPSIVEDRSNLEALALERRPDRRSRQAAIAESEAKLRLTVADRFGNPSVGANYQIDQSRINFIGGQVVMPLPFCNTGRGEIQQRQAERQRALLELRQTEVQIEQEVAAALARWEIARTGVAVYEKEVLPNLRSGLAGIEKLFLQGDPGVDVLRVIDMRRKLLRARSGHLDALWEASQAQADVALAVADPAMTAAR